MEESLDMGAQVSVLAPTSVAEGQEATGTNHHMEGVVQDAPVRFNGAVNVDSLPSLDNAISSGATENPSSLESSSNAVARGNLGSEVVETLDLALTMRPDERAARAHG